MHLNHLTNDELVNQLTLRTDLTDIEHELLDRLIRAMEAIGGLEAGVCPCGDNGCRKESDGPDA